MSEQPQNQEQSQQDQQTQPMLPGTQAQLVLQTEQPKRISRRKFLIIGGTALGVVAVGGAAFLGGTLMNKKSNSPNGLFAGVPGSSGPIGSSSGSGSVMISGNVGPSLGNFISAKELPTVQPDVTGVFVKRNGNSITIGTGNMGITIGAGGSASASTGSQTSYDGPTYEVVITKDTLLYKDTTQLDLNSTADSVQQTVALGSLDDMNTTIMLTVWGKKTGDRYVADVILYNGGLVAASGGTGGVLK
jgi:hypothetical protein